jgi:hypothetical protein
LRFHVEEAGADAKLIQHGPLGVAYHQRLPISTVLVAMITAHTTVPGITDKFIMEIMFSVFGCLSKSKSLKLTYVIGRGV